MTFLDNMTLPPAGAPYQELVVQSHFLLASCGFDNTVKLWDFVAYVGTTSEYNSSFLVFLEMSKRFNFDETSPVMEGHGMKVYE